MSANLINSSSSTNAGLAPAHAATNPLAVSPSSLSPAQLGLGIEATTSGIELSPEALSGNHYADPSTAQLIDSQSGLIDIGFGHGITKFDLGLTTGHSTVGHSRTTQPASLKDLVHGFTSTRLFNLLGQAPIQRTLADQLPPDLKLEVFPLRRLPQGIPEEFQPAFEVLFHALKGTGEAKLNARTQVAAMVEGIAQARMAAMGILGSPETNREGVRQKALYDVVQTFMNNVYGKDAIELRDAFLGAEEFFGHLILYGPFIDSAFGQGGSMESKKTHGVLVHLLDFLEWMLLCKKSNLAKDTDFVRLTQYVGAVNLKAYIKYTSLEIQALEAQKRALAGDPAKASELEVKIAGLRDSVAKSQALLDTVTVPVNDLDWTGTGFTNDGTYVWDVFFDFQNLPNSAFEGADQLIIARGLKATDYIGLSFRVVANPFHLGLERCVKTLFPGIGWY